MTLKNLRELRMLLLSDRVSYKGNELPAITEILNELAADETALLTPAPSPAPVEVPAEAT